MDATLNTYIEFNVKDVIRGVFRNFYFFYIYIRIMKLKCFSVVILYTLHIVNKISWNS